MFDTELVAAHPETLKVIGIVAGEWSIGGRDWVALAREDGEEGGIALREDVRLARVERRLGRLPVRLSALTRWQ